MPEGWEPEIGDETEPGLPEEQGAENGDPGEPEESE